MPDIYSEQLGRAISDTLNVNYGDWNRDFRTAVAELEGKNSRLTISAEMQSDPGSDFPIDILITAISDSSSVQAKAAYIDHGYPDTSQKVILI